MGLCRAAALDPTIPSNLSTLFVLATVATEWTQISSDVMHRLMRRVEAGNVFKASWLTLTIY
jgi:hypothetical protein